jgi:hypothetical protein
MKILVIDGQGGKIGASIIAELKKSLSPSHELIAIGTNSTATGAMLRAGASVGATGENPVVVNAGRVDLIIGTIGIVVANALMGEITPAMALAVGQSSAPKILIPFNRCNTFVAGSSDFSISELIADAIQKAQQLLQKNP